MPPRYLMDCFYFFIGRHFVFTEIFIFIWVHHKFLNSSWTVMMNCSWTFVLELFINFVHELPNLTFYEILVNCSWTIFGFIISSWAVHELFMNVYSFDQQCELFRNYWWIVHELFFFIASSWTVHELWWWTVHEL